MRLRILFTFVSLFSITHLILSNSPSFRNISIEQGLPGTNVHAVFQDSKGIIWMGIESAGLCKFDSKEFTLYANSPKDTQSISSNFPLCITEDKEGNLWIGTSNGLNKYNRKTDNFQRYYHTHKTNNSIPGDYINHLHVDKQGHLWISTRTGLGKLNVIENTFEQFLVGEGTYTSGKPAYIASVFEDKEERIWIASYSSGLFLLKKNIIRDNRSIESWDSVKQLNNTSWIISNRWIPKIKGESTNISVNQICRYDKDHLLIGNYHGLFLFQIRTGTFTRLQLDNQNLSGVPVNNLLRDSEENIWVGFTINGLLKINPYTNQQQVINADQNILKSLKSNTIRDIYEDKTGLIWIGTKYDGVHIYDHRQEVFKKHYLNTYLDSPELNNAFILCIKEQKGKGIWIGTKNKGLFYFSFATNKIKHYHTFSNPSLKTNRIECIEIDDKYIWLGTQNGLHQLNVITNQITTYGDDFIKSIKLDTQGNMWIGSNSSGIFYLKKGSNILRRYKSTCEFFKSKTLGIREIIFSQDSLLWIGTYNAGLIKYNLINDRYKHYRNKHSDSTSLVGSMVRSLQAESNGDVWIGTKLSGLFKYNAHSQIIQPVSINDTNPVTSIVGIKKDRIGNLWAAINNGLLKYNPTTKKYDIFNKTYGLKNKTHEDNASCITEDGTMLFGGKDGLNAFNPKEVVREDLKYSIIFPSVQVYDKVIERDIDANKSITLNYDDKYVFIDYVLTNYITPSDLVFKHKLAPFDKSWVNTANRNGASYTALPSGEYTFQVVAYCKDNSTEIYSPELTLIVNRPFWKKPSFVILIILTLLVIATLLYIIRLRFSKAHEVKLEQTVLDKTQSLMNVNTELEAHKTNLEGIINKRTEELQKEKQKAEESDRMKSAFLANMSHEIRTPLNAIIGLSKILIREVSHKEELVKMGKMIESSGDTLQYLIDDIIDISKIEANQIKIFKEPFPLNECMKNMYTIYNQQLGFTKDIKNIKIFLDLPDEEIFLNSDQSRIEQIFRNLINNAVKFTTKGSITIGYNLVDESTDQARAKFYVADTGSGIHPDEVDLIFNRFKKSETKENIAKGGTGLGLSISYNLVLLLGGKIWVESKLNKGSVFYVELPLDKEKEISFEELAEQINNKTLIEYNWKRKAVLIVEDTEANYMVLEDMLQRTGIDIEIATEGEKAVELIKENPSRFNIILMDINLPGINGKEAMKQIKELNPNVPVIAQTALAMDYESNEILSIGFDAYIAKPINRSHLLKIIADFID